MARVRVEFPRSLARDIRVTTFGGAIMAGIWGGTASAIGAALFGWLYNRAMRWG